MSNDSPRHHLLIAGQGRSGTSLLVRILSACGLNTHLEQHGDDARWFDTANAGLEDTPFSDDAPYVIKSPFAYQFVEQGLDDRRFVLDGAVIPIRSLREAAASRVVTEMTEMLSRPALAAEIEAGGMRDHQGAVPGGVVYSIDPLDVERILATGFTRLIEILVRHDVPMIFLSFPRFAADVDYLYKQLSPIVGDISLADFTAITTEIVDDSKVRIGQAIADAQGVDPHEVAALRRAAARSAAARQEISEQLSAHRRESQEERQRLNQRIRRLRALVTKLRDGTSDPPTDLD